MIAYKLFKVRKDGSIGSLFINQKDRLQINTWLEAKPHRTKGFAFRPGWHALFSPSAPHLSKKVDAGTAYTSKIASSSSAQLARVENGFWRSA